MAKHVHALLPRLASKLGHIYPYHVATQKAAESLGWHYSAYAPKDAPIHPLPNGWEKTLANDLSPHPKSLIEKGKVLLANVSPLRHLFKKIEPNTDAIVFIEHFEMIHLVSICLALLFIRPSFQFWMLFRYSFNGQKKKRLAYRLVLWFISKKFQGKFRALTDSDLLSLSISSDLNIPLTVFPIPHTENASLPKKPLSEKLKFWWPGGLIREDKGLKTLRTIVEKTSSLASLEFFMAKSAHSLFNDLPSIHFIDTYLSPKDYIKKIHETDLIILPYQAQDYKERTSGIFVEAVCMGTLVAVTEKTWMAYEYTKFGLQELIFHWGEQDLGQKLQAVLKEPLIQEKFQAMQRAYQNFHSLKGFAEHMLRLSGS